MIDVVPGDRSASHRDGISILLVDDNQEWAGLAASRIEREAEDIDVMLAGSANEAMVTLKERSDLDCLVVDYMMPRVTGLQLLERVREEYPQLPFLLITSEGSEEIAANAIDAGVTDYIVKDPAGNQTVVFVSRIRSAVEQYRLRQAIEESEARYRTVTEQSRDGIAILEDGRIRFCNQQLAALTERAIESLSGSDLVGEIIHPDDQDRVRSVIDSWDESQTQLALHETRIIQPDGRVKYCEFTGREITYNDDRGLLVSIRDVTDRRRRERELQWERDLNRTIQEALVEAGTRDGLERAVVEQLHRYGYELAWIGHRNDGTISPSVIAGDQGYLEAIDWDLDGSANESEPFLWAARTGEPQFVQDFDDLFPTGWRETAYTYGYRAGAAIPLAYEDITYGLLGVYHDRPARFDETERTLLLELADTVAFAIHSMETEYALAADRAVTATLQVGDEAYYLTDLARAGEFLECDQLMVQGTVSHDDDAIIQYVSIEGGDLAQIRDALATHPDVTDVLSIDEDDPALFQVTVTSPVPEAHLASQRVIVQSTAIGPEGATITIELAGRAPVRSVVDELGDAFDDVSVVAVSEAEMGSRARPALGLDIADLTDKQVQAVQAAYFHGYFDQPRGNTATAIADSLDISHSTFLQHLHRAQAKLFQQLI